jgi:hypothetical protein
MIIFLTDARNVALIVNTALLKVVLTLRIFKF